MEMMISAAILFTLSLASSGTRPILPGDTLEIRCPEDARFCVRRSVLSDGTILLPELGRVSVTRLTAGEAQKSIQLELEGRGVVPVCTISINTLAGRSQTVRVNGLVKREGDHVIHTGATLQEVLGEVQTLPGADTRRIMISTAEGDSFTVDANDRPWSIRAGDRIEVASSTFQAGVFVIGGVDRPGRYEWDDGMTLASAVSLAGGVSADGTQNGWWLRSPGHESRSIRDLETGASVGIAPGDVLVIPRSGPPSDIVVIGAVRQESRMPYRKGMRLKDVLKDSGGVTVDAQRARIEVWATFGGKVRRRVELSAAKGILEDLVLNGGDAVIVREVQVKNAP